MRSHGSLVTMLLGSFVMAFVVWPFLGLWGSHGVVPFAPVLGFVLFLVYVESRQASRRAAPARTKVSDGWLAILIGVAAVTIITVYPVWLVIVPLLVATGLLAWSWLRPANMPAVHSSVVERRPAGTRQLQVRSMVVFTVRAAGAILGPFALLTAFMAFAPNTLAAYMLPVGSACLLVGILACLPHRFSPKAVALMLVYCSLIVFALGWWMLIVGSTYFPAALRGLHVDL